MTGSASASVEYSLTGSVELASEAEWDNLQRLYVVADESVRHSRCPGAVFTLSPRPDVAGWSTDMGCDGYGLPLSVAQKIAKRFNERPDGCAFNPWRDE